MKRDRTASGITPERLDALRAALPSMMSEKRLRHVLAVEEAAVRIGRLYLPVSPADGAMPPAERKLRAAALLHDITKEYTVEEHLNVLLPRGIVPTDIELAAPKTLHAISAAALIPDEYPDLACRDVISSVRWHTTGRAGMSIYDKIIYLADYIDMSRKYPECVRLRSMFWNPDPASMDMPEREEHLRRVLVESFDITLRGLLEDGLPVHPETNRARNSLILRKAETGAGKGPEGPERAE